MAKLNNGNQYFNTNFPVEFAEYLIMNGFSCDIDCNILIFSSATFRIRINQNQMDAVAINPDVTAASTSFEFKYQYAGLKELDFHQWILLMHTLNIIPFYMFVENSKKIDAQHELEAMAIYSALQLSFSAKLFKSKI